MSDTNLGLRVLIDATVNASRQTMIAKGLVGIKPEFRSVGIEWVCPFTGYAFKCTANELINNYEGTLRFKKGNYIFYARS